jgi:hypothetical protein
MPDFLHHTYDLHQPKLASAFDQVSFWSARFGAILYPCPGWLSDPYTGKPSTWERPGKVRHWSRRGILPAESAAVAVEGIQDPGGSAYI